MIRQYKLRDYNFRLVFALLVLTFLGVLLVGSAEPALRNRQLAGMILGVVAMVIVSLMDFSWILNFNWIMYAGNLALLLFVILFGKDANGAQRWINIAGIQFQPTELAKIVIILFFAKFFMDHEEDLNTLHTLVKSAVLIALPLVLILIQPDLKNTITIAILFCILLYVAGLSYKIIGGALLIAVPLAVIFLFIVVQPDQKLIKSYQRDRIMAFLNSEDDEYSDAVLQQENSVTAIGSGQLT
ncbi:MAG: FtsW/RodA/SpoVE family cell cycle protein, partial [Blautia sp.]|nr:FtsW/RodA/SpoVE family cell cycle protein [Blautia sp.]